MSRARRVLVTYGLPGLYLALVVIFNLPEKPEYWLPGRTVMTVSEKAGPMILHMPDPIYPPQALRDSVQGTVTVKVSVAADGTVSQAAAIAGPEALRDAAVDAVRRWQFEGKPVETQVDVGFSLLYVTQSLTPAEPVERTRPSNRDNARGSVRVVAAVDAQGKPGIVQAVAGPEKLRAAAVDSVRQWTFRPTLRNGHAVFGTAVVDVAFGT
jgi:TonB family protein